MQTYLSGRGVKNWYGVANVPPIVGEAGRDGSGVMVGNRVCVAVGAPGVRSMGSVVNTGTDGVTLRFWSGARPRRIAPAQ